MQVGGPAPPVLKTGPAEKRARSRLLNPQKREVPNPARIRR